MSTRTPFKWDVFVSYASVDDAPVLDAPGWVGDFISALSHYLDALSGRRERVRIFKDTGLRKSERVSEALDRSVQESAVFLAFLSPGFMNSPFCQRELGLFISAASQGNIGLSSRSGLLRIVPIRLAGRKVLAPDPLNLDIIGYNFAKNEDVGFPITTRSPEFLVRVQELAQGIMAILDDLRLSSRPAPTGAPGEWLDDSVRILASRALSAPIFRLNDEDRRFGLITRAFATRAPALHHYLRRGLGNIDEWVETVIDITVDYGIADSDNALSILLDTLAADNPSDARALNDARTAVAKCWNSYRQRHDGAVQTPLPRLRRVLGADEIDIAEDYPESSCSPAWELQLGERVRRLLVLKNMRANARNDVRSDMFRQLAELRHPNILPLHDYLIDGTTIMGECDWRTGSKLSSATGPLNMTEIRDLVLQIADALDFAHLTGVVHGRLNPDCILLDTKLEFVTIMGFGYVWDDRSAEHILTWQVPNSLDVFIAPEARHGIPGPSSDQYSLAALVYALLTGVGRDWHSGEELCLAARELISGSVAEVVERAMRSDPAARFGSTMEFADALRWSLDTGIQQSADRAREHSYLSLLRQECVRAVGGYVTLRGKRTPPGSKVLGRDALTGAGRVSLHHPIVYRIASARTQEAARLSEDVSRDLREGGRVLLLGEPGSGKTTTLLHAALEACREAQLNVAAPIPVVVPLNLYDGRQTMRQFIEEQMWDLAPQFDRLLSENRLLLLFDALNEMEVTGRGKVREYAEQLGDFVISCRTRDYQRDLDDLAQVTLITILPLDIQRIRIAFEKNLGSQGARLWNVLGGCTQVLNRFEKMQRQGDAERFWEVGYVPGYTSRQEDAAWESMQHKGILAFCQNPFLLRVVAEIFRAEGEVPENRSAIFAASVQTLIRRELERLAQVESWSNVEERLATAEERMRRFLAEVAGLIQSRQGGAGIDREAAIGALSAKLDARVAEGTLDLAEDATILVRTGDRLVFSHQLLQEYFASSVMQDAFQRGESAERFFPRDSWYRPQGWEETAIILAGVLGREGAPRFVRWLAKSQPVLTLRCIEEAGIPDWSIEAMPLDLRQWLTECWLALWAEEEGRAAARAAIGRALGIVGDPRSGVGIQVQSGISLPDIEWVEVNDDGACISKYPITVAQYRCFEIAEQEHGRDATGIQEVSAERVVGRCLNDPKTDVTWESATRFGAWLSECTGVPIRLPWEHEWMRAAFMRGNERSRYPWGPVWSSGRGNVADGSDAQIGSPSPVGVFDDRSAQVLDLFGNVWEWCLDGQAVVLYDDGANAENKRSYRLLKGGSWKRTPEFATGDYRYWAEAGYSSTDIGFRVVGEFKTITGSR